jgi:hypothetical protein
MNLQKWATVTKYYQAVWSEFSAQALSEVLDENVSSYHMARQEKCDGIKNVIATYTANFFDTVNLESTQLFNFQMQTFNDNLDCDVTVSYSIRQTHSNSGDTFGHVTEYFKLNVDNTRITSITMDSNFKKDVKANEKKVEEKKIEEKKVEENESESEIKEEEIVRMFVKFSDTTKCRHERRRLTHMIADYKTKITRYNSRISDNESKIEQSKRTIKNIQPRITKSKELLTKYEIMMKKLTSTSFDHESSSSVSSDMQYDQNTNVKSLPDLVSPRPMTPPSRSKSPVKSLFLKFSPKRSSPDNSPRSPDSCPTTNLPSPTSPHSPHSQSGSLSPTSNKNGSSISPTVTPRPLIKSISSPRQRRSSFSTLGFLIRGSPPRKTSSLLNSTEEINILNQPPIEDQINYTCHQCRRGIIVDRERELFLAIKCTCQGPPCYFCTRECQRGHWITLNTRGTECSFDKFEKYVERTDSEFPLADALTWDQKEYVHKISEYLVTSLYTD